MIRRQAVSLHAMTVDNFITRASVTNQYNLDRGDGLAMCLSTLLQYRRQPDRLWRDIKIGAAL